jgi:acetyl-CoA C-acetyltransferase
MSGAGGDAERGDGEERRAGPSTHVHLSWSVSGRPRNVSMTPTIVAMSAVELAAAGARAALDDCGADAAKVAASIDTVAGVRQFEISGPVRPVLGKSNNYPRSVANRIDADPARAILEIVGGQGPQHLITELAGEIANGRSEVALIFGSDATSTTRYFGDADNRPDFSETVDGSLEDRGHGLDGVISRYTVIHGLVDAPTQLRAAGECPTGTNRTGSC